MSSTERVDSTSDTSFEKSIEQITQTINENYNPLIPKIEEEKPLGIAELKMRYMRNHLLSAKADYCQYRNLSTICVTWNVNGREPQEDLSLMLPEEESDIFVLGLQEVDRRAEAYMYAVSNREQLWTEATQKAFNNKYPEDYYQKIASKSLVGLLIIVMVKGEHVPHIGKISVASASCGIMGIVGNKGAVAVRLKIYNDYVCFINCHLAAHPNQILRRNQDLADLHKRLLFPLGSRSLKAKKNRNESFTDFYWHLKGFAGVEDCDILFWLGDFNYRVEMEGQLVRIFVQHGQIDSVLQNDQMMIQKNNSQEHLSKYSEAEITFTPSYSFDIGTNNYDSSEKQRVPSWCDRIIWRSGDRVESKIYDCLFDYKESDHKPVRLASNISISEIVIEKYEACYFESLKQLDAFENATIPDTEVNRHVIDAGIIAYHHMAKESFKIINKGRVMAQYRFIFHEDEKLKTPNWIRIEPIQGLIAPGQSEEIKLSFIYDNYVAISDAREKDHILVLHIEGGRDHFISVGFKCRETSFGKELKDLKFHRVLLDRNEPKLLFKVPTVLWRLVDFLIDQPIAMKTPNLFLLSGTTQFNNSIQNSLDLNEPFSDEINCEAGFHSIAESILRFFGALPDSLIPYIYYEKCLQASKSLEATFKILNEIPEINFMVFEYFLRFIRDMLLPQNQTISRSALCQVIGFVLIRPQNGHKITKKEAKELSQFFSNLINKP